jgi:hypothetical protein
METLIVQPKDKEQLAALKAIMKALKVDYKTEKSEKTYNKDFVNKMKQSEGDLEAGRTTQINPADIWSLE